MCLTPAQEPKQSLQPYTSTPDILENKSSCVKLLKSQVEPLYEKLTRVNDLRGTSASTYLTETRRTDPGQKGHLTCLVVTDRCNQHTIALWNFSPEKENLTGQRGCQYFLWCCDQVLPVLNFCKASAWWSECQLSWFHFGATGWRDVKKLQPQALSNTYQTSSNGMKKVFAISQLWFINSSCCPWLLCQQDKVGFPALKLHLPSSPISRPTFLCFPSSVEGGRAEWPLPCSPA